MRVSHQPYPKKDGRPVHTGIAEQVLGRPLKGEEGVHHVDGNGWNNSHTNLVIFPNYEYHALLHIRTKALEACGNPNHRQCTHCKRWDDPSHMHKHSSKSWAHRKCQREYEYERNRKAFAKLERR